MRVDFRFKPGDSVTIRGCSLVHVVLGSSINAGGEKTYRLIDSGSQLVLNLKNGFDHKESDLQRVGDPPADPEPHFDLLGHDTLAAETVRFWAHLAEESGHVPQAKIDGAVAIADAMDAWPHHRLPD